MVNSSNGDNWGYKVMPNLLSCVRKAVKIHIMPGTLLQIDAYSLLKQFAASCMYVKYWM